MFRRAPGRLALLLLLLALLGQLGGCGLLAKNTDPGAQGADTAQTAQNGETGQGANGEGSGDGPAWDSDPVPYKVDIEVLDGPGSLKGQMRDASQLVKLAKEPPDSMLALERRARADEETAVKLLHSQC